MLTHTQQAAPQMGNYTESHQIYLLLVALHCWRDLCYCALYQDIANLSA